MYEVSTSPARQTSAAPAQEEALDLSARGKQATDAQERPLINASAKIAGTALGGHTVSYASSSPEATQILLLPATCPHNTFFPKPLNGYSAAYINALHASQAQQPPAQQLSAGSTTPPATPQHRHTATAEHSYQGPRPKPTTSVTVLPEMDKSMYTDYVECSSTHPPSKKKVYQCSKCDNTYNTKTNLNRHIKAAHFASRPHKCTLCEYSASSKQHLDLHHRTHTGEKPYKCDLCNHATRSSSNLRTHQKAVHQKTTHTISIARHPATSVTVPPEVDESMYTIHAVPSLKHPSGEKKVYQCERCKTYKKHKKYEKYGEYGKYGKYAYKSNDMGNMKRHIRSVHMSYKPYQCELCSVRTFSRSHMKEHKKIHSEEKLYRCDICDYDAVQSSSLGRHKTSGTHKAKVEEAERHLKNVEAQKNIRPPTPELDVVN